MSIVYITNDMFKECFNTLNNNLETPGIHEYSQELLTKNGVSLRLEGAVECITKVVIDDKAKALQDKSYEVTENKLRVSAAAAGLTVTSYMEKQHEKRKAERIKQLAEKFNISIETATTQVEQEDATETKVLKTKFYRENHPETVNETEGFSTSDVPDEILANIPEFEFKEWRYKQERLLNKKADPTKEITVIKTVTPLHIVYSFDESITGINGFDTVAKKSLKNETTLPSVETFKALFKGYIESEEFTKGLKFISKIAGNDITVKLR